MSDPGPGPVTAQLELHPEDPDDEWPTRQTRPGLRLHAPTAVLVTLLVLAGGFWGGALAEKHHGSSSAGSNSFSALASRLAATRAGTRGAGAATAANGGAGASGAGTAGTPGTAGIVTEVKGSVLYLTNAAGNLVKVDVGPSTTITRTSKSSLAGLQTGDTVVVQGAAASGGAVNATSVRATAQGVTAGGGFGAGSATGGAGGFGSGGAFGSAGG